MAFHGKVLTQHYQAKKIPAHPLASQTSGNGLSRPHGQGQTQLVSNHHQLRLFGLFASGWVRQRPHLRSRSYPVAPFLHGGAPTVPHYFYPRGYGRHNTYSAIQPRKQVLPVCRTVCRVPQGPSRVRPSAAPHPSIRISEFSMTAEFKMAAKSSRIPDNRNTAMTRH